MFWNAIQAFIDPVTKSKCKFDEAIKDEVPSRQLSSEFGGELDSTYNHEEYWNDLVKLSGERRKDMLRRFKEDCNSEVGASEWVIRGGDDETSPFNAKSTEVATSDVGTSSMSSHMPSIDPSGGERARSAAVGASDNRVDQSRSPIQEEIPSSYEEAQTPLSEQPLQRFMTPSTTLNKTPLDRTLSSLAEGTDAKDHSEVHAETQTEKIDERRHSGFKEKFNKLGHVFHHNSSRKSSREALNATHDDKVKAADLDRKANVETDEDLSARGTMPSAPEVAKLAGTAGLGGAAGAVAGSGGNKAHDAAIESSSDSNATRINKSIEVLYFASAKEAAGIGRQSIPLPEIPFPLSKLGDYLTQLVSSSNNGDAKSFEKVLKTSRWSVNEDMVDEDDLAKMTLQGGEDVAIIPPVSGG